MLVATGVPGLRDLCGDDCPWLLPMGRGTVLENWMARLAGAGVRVVHVVASAGVTRVREVVGDGGRWGVAATVHGVAGEEAAATAFRRIDADRVLLADCACDAGGEDVAAMAARTDSRTLRSADGVASCVAVVSGSQLRSLADVARSDVPSELAKRFATLASEVRRLDAPADLIAANRRLLRTDDSLFRDGDADRVRFGRNVRLHPTARVVGPVVIGDDVTVGAGVELGPEAVVGRGVVLDDGAVVRRAVIGDRSYVGAGLAVSESVVAGRRVANPALGTTVAVEDRRLLDALGRRSVRRRSGGYAVWLLAASAWLLTRPLMALPTLTRGPVRGPRTHFLRRVVPGLSDVLTGRRRLVGPAMAFAGDRAWRPPAAASGLIDEHIARKGRPGGALETRAADAYYAAHAGTRYDLRLLTHYAWRVLRGV